MDLKLEVIMVDIMEVVILIFTWPLQNNQVQHRLELMQMQARQIYNTCYNVSNRK